MVDYIHQNLHLDQIISGYFWSIFGIGSLIGPFLIGVLSDKIGTKKSLLTVFLAAIIFVSTITFFSYFYLYLISSFFMGAILPSIVLLTSKIILELVGANLHPKFWGRMTLIYAISQESGSYFMSFLLHLNYDYQACFFISIASFFSGFLFLLFV